MADSVEKTNYAVLARYLVNRYIQKISGTGSEDLIVGERPSDTIMVGMLAANRVRKTYNGGYEENPTTFYSSVPSIAVSFLVDRESSGRIKIQPLGYFYYRIKTEYDIQIKQLLRARCREYNKEFKTLAELVKYINDKGLDPTFSLCPVYKRVSLEDYVDALEVDIENLKSHGRISLHDQLYHQLKELARTIYPESIVSSYDQKIPIEELSDQHSFENLTRPSNDQYVLPNWDLDIIVETYDVGSELRITVRLVNISPEHGKLGGRSYDPNLYNAQLKITGLAGLEFLDINLDYFRDDYRRKASVKGISENASLEYCESTNSLITVNIPVFYQKRLVTKDHFERYTSFRQLVSHPLECLDAIAAAMDSDYESLLTEFHKKKGQLAPTGRKTYREHLEQYRCEILRFKRGVEILRNKKLALKAFCYMNESFSVMLNPKQRVYRGWRLFQLVFIVSLINDIVASEYPEDPLINLADLDTVDLLHFPTGGGKTEAFLGATVFAAFFDRLRGKQDGVTSIIKYPLRLLSIQQLERVLVALVKAEYVRIRHSELAGKPFSIGYYVGSGNTANRIRDDRDFHLLSQNDLDAKYRLIDRCPYCGNRSIHVRFDQEHWRLLHCCLNKDCAMDHLPLYVIDDEIYRFLPTVIISTIDKMSLIGLTSDFKAIWGQVDGFCPKHGYTVGDRCTPGSLDCTETIKPVTNLRDPVPTLVIQDELHLVRESLGTFASHYETFLRYYASSLIREATRKKMKYIGATATISNYQDHIWNLYHLPARCFPAPYPKIDENFYSYVDHEDLNRIIVGYAPYGRSVTDAMWQSVTFFREIVYRCIEEIETTYEDLLNDGFIGEREQLLRMLDEYWVAITYNNARQDVVDLTNAFQNQGNNYLYFRRIPGFAIEQMTGEESFQDIRRVLFDVEANKGQLGNTNLIIATSTISHGVDEDIFNQLFFFGIPRSTAEYIQAYSRVGRKRTGIVFDVIRLARERDRSYLKNFHLFHKCQEYLVDPVPINRWAKNAIYSTLPGLLSALLLQYYSNHPSYGSLARVRTLQKALLNGQIESEDVKRHLHMAYGCSPLEKVSCVYEEIIDEEVERILNGIRSGSFSPTERTGDAIARFASKKKRPMTSLRDTDELVTIKVIW